jgi:MoaA/NifB/PqqE/SkfB family radical SAM enzyme
MFECKKHFSWEIHHACNYSCSYCFLQGKDFVLADAAAVYRPSEEWRIYWDRFHERFGPARIDISGGEPFLYPGFSEILNHLSQKHNVYVITNFSQDVSGMVDAVSPENVRLVLSMHPEHLSSAREFLQKACVLKERGFIVRITAVAYPPHIETVLSYSRMCEACGFKFIGTPFFGSYLERQYPQAYTDSEKESISGMLGDPRPALYQFQELNPQGLRCNAGVNYGRISPDGTVKPCLNSSSMGNFPDPDFSFMEKPVTCPSPHCHCMLEFEYCHGEKKGPVIAN